MIASPNATLLIVKLALGYQAALDIKMPDDHPRDALDKAMRIRAWEWFSSAQRLGIVLQ